MNTSLLEWCGDTSRVGRGYLVVVSLLASGKTTTAIQRELCLSKQQLHKRLCLAAKKGLVAHEHWGVWTTTPKGLECVNAKYPQNPRGQGLVEVRGVRDWVSAHHDLTFRFALRSQNFDRAPLVKRKDGKSYFYCSDLGVSGRVGRTHVFFTVFGVKSNCVRGLFEKALPLALRAARRFTRETGARVARRGEVVGLPHFVVIDRALAAWLRKGLVLDVGPRRVGGVDWWVDASHPSLVEFSGPKARVEGVSDEVVWLLEGGARSLLEEVRGLRSDLRFKPSGAPRREVS
jgi:hypothetical protein